MARYEVVLRNSDDGAGNSRRIKAYLNDEGDLVLEGNDVGPKVEAAWGRDDYEYWRRVKSQHVPKLLLELVKERFTSDYEFRTWLKVKGIPAEFESWF